MDTAEGEDFVRARFAPKHARLLASLADDCTAARFDHPGADEVFFCPEGSVLHACDVVHEVAQSSFHFPNFPPLEGLLAGLLDDAFDPVVAQQF